MLKKLLFAAIVAAAAPQPALAAGDAEAGKSLAADWCSSCHVVSSEQASAMSDAPPFATVAQKYGDDVEVLAAFLYDPHPPMPKLSLTRRQVLDLIAYIASLR